MNKFIRPYHLTEKYGKNFPFYSFSKCTTIENCPYEYKLGLMHKKESNIYSEIGNIVHSTLEDVRENPLSNDDIIKIIKIKLNELFSTHSFYKDQKRDALTKSNYLYNIAHFFKYHKPSDIEEFYVEKPIWLDLSDDKCCVFLGFIDLLLVTKDKKYIIIDYKTGSIDSYMGKDKFKKEMQMNIYCLGLEQEGVNIKDIECYWNFIQYSDVSFYDNNILIDNKKVKRNEILSEFGKNILKYCKIEDELSVFFDPITTLLMKKDFENLDNNIKSKFNIDECIINVEINNDTLEKTKIWLKEKVLDIENRIYNNNWEYTPPINKKFYCENLCSVSQYCKYLHPEIKNIKNNMEI